jgi:hypothetical protein
MNGADELTKSDAKGPLAVNRQPLRQPLGQSPVFIDPGYDRQLMAA